jgi:hypothetical protein
MRCIKSNRVCGGYEHSGFSAFRLHGAQGENEQSVLVSTARKCGMPKRVPIPGTDILPEDKLLVEISQAESSSLALRAFVYDYCITLTNSNLSQGFLSGLEMMACRLGPKSDLAKACQAVAFASHGKPLRRPRLLNLAERYYQELLASLARVIENPLSANALKSKLIAMLLGLYQVPILAVPDLRV